MKNTIQTDKRINKLLQSSYKPKLMMSGGSHRCSICNAVDNSSIETNIGDFHPNTPFTYDPKDPSHFICISCEEVIADVRQDYAYMDEDNEEERE